MLSPAVESVRFVGENGLLIGVRSTEHVHRLTAWVRAHPRAGQLQEVIPAAETVFLVGDRRPLEELAKDVATAKLPEIDRTHARTVVVPVRYDGIDLEDVAERTGMGHRELIKAHCGSEYRVEFFGFSPGQAFFSGVPEPLRIARRNTPRTHVPTGSLAIANQFTVIYPVDSPGGWNLIGTRAGKALWDSSAEPPNAVDVGDRICFKEVS